jgi:hypothetical protein
LVTAEAKKKKKKQGHSFCKGAEARLWHVSLPVVKLLVGIVTASPVVTSEAQVFANYWLVK